jgi:hypothetical protein
MIAVIPQGYRLAPGWRISNEDTDSSASDGCRPVILRNADGMRVTIGREDAWFVGVHLGAIERTDRGGLT